MWFQGQSRAALSSILDWLYYTLTQPQTHKHRNAASKETSQTIGQTTLWPQQGYVLLSVLFLFYPLLFHGPNEFLIVSLSSWGKGCVSEQIKHRDHLWLEPVFGSTGERVKAERAYGEGLVWEKHSVHHRTGWAWIICKVKLKNPFPLCSNKEKFTSTCNTFWHVDKNSPVPSEWEYGNMRARMLSYILSKMLLSY